MTTYRILVTGGRYWKDRASVWDALDAALDAGRTVWTTGDFGEFRAVVVHGACPSGADQHAVDWCRANGIADEPHPADWERYGDRAGPIRNTEMINRGVHVCLAFPERRSRGTFDTIRKARAAGVYVINYGAERYGARTS